MTQGRRALIERNIIAGLPAPEASYDREAFRRQMAEYEGATPGTCAANLGVFVKEVAPVAAELGLRMCIHPDDPPWPFLGCRGWFLPLKDVRAIFGASDIRGTNGLTFCVGSFGRAER